MSGRNGAAAPRGTVVVESLTARASSALLSHLWAERRAGRRVERGWFFEGSRLGVGLSRAVGRLMGARIERLEFRLHDVRDEHGASIRLRMITEDLAEQVDEIGREELFRCAANSNRQEWERLETYLVKALASPQPMQAGSLWRALLVVAVSKWAAASQGDGGSPGRVTVMIERRPWARAIEACAQRRGIAVHLTPAPLDVGRRIRRWIPLDLKRAINRVLKKTAGGSGFGAVGSGPKIFDFRFWICDWEAYLALLESKIQNRKSKIGPAPNPEQTGVFPQPVKSPRVGQTQPPVRKPAAGPRLAVEFYGQLNLKRPERYSDLFFWQQSRLPAREIVVLFGIPSDPFDERKRIELEEQGMDAAVVELDGRSTPAVDQASRGRLSASAAAGGRVDRRTVRWLKERLTDYEQRRAYWTRVFSEQRVGCFVTWFKYDSRHCAMADALQSLGGISAIYQRAYEFGASPETRLSADVVFGFSAAEVERRSGSRIGYYVTTGYLGDHRFALLRGQAAQLRRMLESKGARRILAYTDENSHEESRWSLGHDATRANYLALLGRVVREPWLGLLIKPKIGLTLRRRLGPVAGLLDRAMATGRCLMVEGDEPLHNSVSPALVALASDVMIHGHLYAATAGMEAAMAGAPTLLVDLEGLPSSPLNQLGEGRVIFRDWEALWKACLDHWRAPGGCPGFGDWTPLLDALDPFRDGRAAARMGTYVEWLLEGLKAGRPREAVLAAAAERYAEAWGADKVTSVNQENEITNDQIPITK